MEDIVPQNTPYNNLPITSGIYKITCTANKKIYIGSAVNLRNRKNEHFRRFRQNKHDNPKLQRAWNKYGEQAFTFEILELVLPMSLTAREQYWFNKLKPFGNKGFNIATEAGSLLGYKQSPEHIEKRRQARLGKKMSPEAVENNRQAQLGRRHTPEAREKIGKARRGKKLSPEQIKKMSQSQSGHKVSEETKEKLRQANLGKKQSPETINKRKIANLGKKHTPEAKENMRLAALGNTRNVGRKHTPESVEKSRLARIGAKRSPESKERMSQASKRTYLTRKRREDGTFA